MEQSETEFFHQSHGLLLFFFFGGNVDTHPPTHPPRSKRVSFSEDPKKSVVKAGKLQTSAIQRIVVFPQGGVIPTDHGV